ncbi:MAG: hypothetical protein HY791_29245 [Deltaproteobacteria bacterium]|nr:hypothetical protein [Deltaproteobacteria bacterium]
MTSLRRIAASAPRAPFDSQTRPAARAKENIFEAAKRQLAPKRARPAIAHDVGDVLTAIEVLKQKQPVKSRRDLAPNGAPLASPIPENADRLEWKKKPDGQALGHYFVKNGRKTEKRFVWGDSTPEGEKIWRPIPSHVASVDWSAPAGAQYVGRYTDSLTGTYGYVFTEDTIKKNNGDKFVKVSKVDERYADIVGSIKKDLASANPLRWVPAAAVMLMDREFIRVGNEKSAERGRYGVTTLERRHFTLRGDTIRIAFVGKSGKSHEKEIESRPLARALAKLLVRTKSPKDRVFEIDGAPLRADQVNAYLAPHGITAKDFRTYHATRLAKRYLDHVKKSPRSQLPKVVSQMYAHVAGRLGHSPGVCAKHYVSPTVVREFLRNRLS